jgi:hypothetical protein
MTETPKSRRFAPYCRILTYSFDGFSIVDFCRVVARRMESIAMPEPATEKSLTEAKFIDRRAFPRRRPRCGATYRPADKLFAPDVQVKLTCISQGGACLLAPKEPARGDYILVSLLSPAAGVAVVTLKAIVRWTCKDTATGRFRVGCAWVDRPDYGQLIPFW